MRTNVAWSVLVLMVAAVFYLIAFFGLFRTKTVMERITRLKYGSMPPEKELRKQKSVVRIWWVRIFLGGITFFFGTLFLIVAVGGFVTAVARV